MTCHKPFQFNGHNFNNEKEEEKERKEGEEKDESSDVVVDVDKYIKKCECGSLNFIISFSNDTRTKNKKSNNIMNSGGIIGGRSSSLGDDGNMDGYMDDNEEINEMNDLIIIDNYFKVENSIFYLLFIVYSIVSISGM